MGKTSSKEPLRIGFFAPNDFEYVSRLTDGILRYQADRGGCVIRDFRYDGDSAEDHDAWAKRPRPWETWAPHGLIVSVSADSGLAGWVKAGGLPVMNTGNSPTPLPAVHLCMEGIARVAIEHFEPLGFTHFAYLAVEPIDLRSAVFERRLKPKGFSLRTVNLPINPSHWDDDLESQLSDNTALTELLRDAPKPLAIVAATDNVGRVACRAAKKLGFDIPREVGVLGIGNFSVSRTCDPPLSSIHAPGDEVSYRAMEVLVGIIDGRPAPKRIVVQPGKVYARESTTGGKEREADVLYAMEVIRDRACEGVSIDQVVAELQMSRSTLYREFAAHFGLTPAEEMSRIRLERAKELLGKSQVPITRIAGMLGYANPTGFGVFFQTQTGMTPRAYRKKLGNQ